MIFIGYQGIGKTSLSKNSFRYIDLESSNFWVDEKRADNWYIPYCNIAEDLSRQGYSVFVSSHEVVRKQLINSKEIVVGIYPAAILHEEWLNKLEQRYRRTYLTKDYKAWMNAVDRYLDNIKEIERDTKYHIVLQDIDYILYNEILKFSIE